jgi:hypothetical protein
VFVAHATYWNPDTEELVERPASSAQVRELLVSILQLRSAKGHPALELRRDDGSSVALGTDGEWAVISWVDPLGESFSSAGESAARRLVYDYFGSWSEAPGTWLVPLADAVRCLESFVLDGSPATERVLFRPV